MESLGPPRAPMFVEYAPSKGFLHLPNIHLDKVPHYLVMQYPLQPEAWPFGIVQYGKQDSYDVFIDE